MFEDQRPQTDRSDPRSPAARRSPFWLANEEQYRRWRDRKLANYPTDPSGLMVEVDNPLALRNSEVAELRRVCRKSNMAIYSSRLASADPREVVHEMARGFGLTRLDANLLADEDAISALQVVPEKGGRGYIPYTNRRLLWHTDGYYNDPQHCIRAFILHCVRPAARGGVNGLLDPEIAYLRLRDADPRHVEALMAVDAMTIPANVEPGAEIRPARTGPVFSVDAESGSLHMRYTARTRSVQWKDDEATRAAVAMLESLLAEDSFQVFHHRLEAGQGLLCNNVLHNRTEFEDDARHGPRLLYRARYYDRIAGTAPDLTG